MATRASSPARRSSRARTTGGRSRGGSASRACGSGRTAPGRWPARTRRASRTRRRALPVLLGLLALALVDSINPSAIVVTLFLLSRGRVPAQVIVYVAAIFLTYLALGVSLVLGFDAVLPSLRTVGQGRLGIVLEGLVGLAMLAYAIRAPATAPPESRVEPAASTYAALALLGVTVTALELPTAVPYFGAIAILSTADLPMARWLPLLVIYNAIFVLPPLLLLVSHMVYGRRLDARYASLRERLQAGARETMIWIFGLVGGALLVTSVIEYVARFVLRRP